MVRERRERPAGDKGLMEQYFKNSSGVLYHGDNRDVLQIIPDNSIDLIVTDPPYALTSPGVKNPKGGFMGKSWDKAVPPVETWKECLRILKPGAFSFIMCATRQDCQAKMIVNLQEAGFDVSFTSLFHTYSQGFPKAQNVGKSLDKRLGMERKVLGRKGGRYDYNASTLSSSPMGNVDPRDLDWESAGNVTGPASPEAQALDGSYSNFSPKPALELILVVRKPFRDKHMRSDVYQMLNGKYDYWYTAKTVVTEKNISQVSEKWGELLVAEFVEGDVIERRLALTQEHSDEVILNRCEVLVSKPFKNTDITSSITHAIATGKGVSWLEDGRIPYETSADKDEQAAKNPHTVKADNDVYGDYSMCKDEWVQPQGRFAPNLLVSDDVLDNGRITKSGVTIQPVYESKNVEGFQPNPKAVPGYNQHNDSGSFTRYFSLDQWGVKHLPSLCDIPISYNNDRTFFELVSEQFDRIQSKQGSRLASDLCAGFFDREQPVSVDTVLSHSTLNTFLLLDVPELLRRWNTLLARNVSDSSSCMHLDASGVLCVPNWKALGGFLDDYQEDLHLYDVLTSLVGDLSLEYRVLLACVYELFRSCGPTDDLAGKLLCIQPSSLTYQFLLSCCRTNNSLHEIAREIKGNLMSEQGRNHLPESVLKTYPFLIVSKPSSKEKNSGLDDRTPAQVNDGRKSSIDNPYQRGDSLRRNTHTTIKPITLMAYLLTIGSRPGDTILDPFSGSGSTLIAAALLHRPFVGIELEEEYCDITERRLWHFTQNREQMDFDILLNGK